MVWIALIVSSHYIGADMRKGSTNAISHLGSDAFAIWRTSKH
jgi:hypothetical protein